VGVSTFFIIYNFSVRSNTEIAHCHYSHFIAALWNETRRRQLRISSSSCRANHHSAVPYAKLVIITTPPLLEWWYHYKFFCDGGQCTVCLRSAASASAAAYTARFAGPALENPIRYAHARIVHGPGSLPPAVWYRKTLRTAFCTLTPPAANKASCVGALELT
jgi:hypothetical protein